MKNITYILALALLINCARVLAMDDGNSRSSEQRVAPLGQPAEPATDIYQRVMERELVDAFLTEQSHIEIEQLQRQVDMYNQYIERLKQEKAILKADLDRCQTDLVNYGRQGQP